MGDEGLVATGLNPGENLSQKPPLTRNGTAVFLKKTMSKLSSLEAQSKHDLMAEEEAAEQKRKAEMRKKMSLKRENSMAGMFKRKATLPRIDMKKGNTNMNAKARGSVFGLCTAKLLEQSNTEAEEDDPNNEMQLTPLESEPPSKPLPQSTVSLKFGRPTSIPASKSSPSLHKKDKGRHTVVNQDATAKEIKPTLMGELRRLYNGSGSSADIEPEGEGVMDRENSFTSDKSLLMRESLKFSQKLRALVTVIWLAAKKDSHIELKNKMTKKQYLLLNRKLQICVLGEFDEKEGQKLAEADWERDTCGKDYLDFEGVFQSFFELVDMWTDDINEAAYCRFMDELVQRMVHKKSNQLEFRDDDKIVTRRLYLRSKANFGLTILTIPSTPSEVYAMYAPKPADPQLDPLRPANVWSQIDTSIKTKRVKAKKLRF